MIPLLLLYVPDHNLPVYVRVCAFAYLMVLSMFLAAMERLNGAVLNNGRGPKLKVLLAESPNQR